MNQANERPGRWPPRRCEMPDLSGLRKKIVLDLILNWLFRGRRPLGQKPDALVNSFIRLVDKVVLEYEAARLSLLEYVSAPRGVMSPLFNAAGHLENCLNSLKRAIRFADGSVPRRHGKEADMAT